MKKKHILVIKVKKAFTSIEQAGNWLKGLKKQIKQRAVLADEVPVNIDTDGERKRFLSYGISLLDPNDYPADQKEKIMIFKNLLMALIQGYTIEGIAVMSKCSLKTAKAWEKEAIAHVKDAINKRRKHGVPILGGKKGGRRK